MSPRAAYAWARGKGGRTPGQTGSTEDQALGEIRLVREHDAGPATQQSPRGRETVRHWPLARERSVDPTAHLRFVLRVSGEQNTQVETVLDSFGASVVRSKGTGWLVLPMAAQGHSDRTAGGPSSASSPMASTASCANA